MAFACLPFARPGEGVYIRESITSTLQVGRVKWEEEGRKARAIAVLLATDPHADDNEKGGVQIGDKFTESFLRA